MPNIKPYMMPEDLKLHGVEEGSAAWVRAGTVTREYADQSARLIRETGDLWAKGFRDVGQGLKSLEGHAQATADTSALLEANKDLSELDLKSANQISEMGKAKLNEKTGEMETMSLEDATHTAASMHDAYSQSLDSVRQKMVAGGASSKSLAQFDEHVISRQAENATKLNAQVHQIEGIQATTNQDKLVNNSAALASANPGDLDTILKNYRHGMNAAFATGVMTEETMKAMGPKALADQETIIKAGIEAKARSGPEGLNQALQDIRDPKYAPFIGKNVDAMENTLHRFASEQATANREQKKEADAEATRAMQVRSADYEKANSTGPPWSGKNDPLYKTNPDAVMTQEAKIKAGRADRNGEQVPRELSDPTEAKLFQDNILKDVDKKEALHAIDVELGKKTLSWDAGKRLTERLNLKENPDIKETDKTQAEFMKGMEATIKGQGADQFAPLNDKAIANQKFYEAQMYVLKERQKIEKGLGDTKDPNDLFDPDSKVYLGNKQAFKDLFYKQDTAPLPDRGSSPADKLTPLPKEIIGNNAALDDWAAKLPPGATFIGPDGHLHTKPAAKPFWQLWGQ